MSRRGVDADRVRSWLAELPGFQERETWGHPTFRVGERMFAALDADETRLTVKATVEEQSALVGEDPGTFSVPAYVGRHGWVAVDLSRADAEHVRELLVDAWRRTAPKRAVRAWDTGPG